MQEGLCAARWLRHHTKDGMFGALGDPDIACRGAEDNDDD